MTDTRSAEGKPHMHRGRPLFRSHSERYPLDLFSYTREAGYCLDEHRFLAAISMASSAIELILNRDRRLKARSELKRISGWATLNNGNLRVANKHGLPVHTLLSPGEDLKRLKPIAFVELRNKVVHGEIGHLVRNLSDYDPDAARLAAEQDDKMRYFVSEWYNTAPDVQEGHIRNHQWPSLP